MIRARNISPRLLDDGELAETGPFGWILYVGLSMLADREGRLEDRPALIKARVFPYWTVPQDDTDPLDSGWQNVAAPAQRVDYLLSLLAARGLIDRYVVEGKAIIQILRFDDEQNPHPRESQSVLPAKAAESTQYEEVSLRQTLGAPIRAVPSVPSIASFSLSDVRTTRDPMKPEAPRATPAVNGSGRKTVRPPRYEGRKTKVNNADIARKPPGKAQTVNGAGAARRDEPGGAGEGGKPEIPAEPPLELPMRTRQGGLEPLSAILGHDPRQNSSDALETPSSAKRRDGVLGKMRPHNPADLEAVRLMLLRYCHPGLGSPDNGICCQVLDSSRGASLSELERVIYGFWRAKKLGRMYSWGFLPMALESRFRDNVT